MIMSCSYENDLDMKYYESSYLRDAAIKMFENATNKFAYFDVS